MTDSDLQREKMLNTPVFKLVTSLAIPTIIIQLITLIYNTADTYFISQINKSASAAVGSVFAIMCLIQAIGFGFGMGSSSICSRMLGQKQDEEANKYCSSAFFGAVVFGALLGIFGNIFLDGILRLIGCSETMLVYARPYSRCILVAAPVSCATYVLNNALRSEGQSKLAMFGMVSGGIVNMLLDPVFIFYFNLGTLGAALATAFSQCISFTILLSSFVRNKTILHIGFRYISKKAEDYKLIFATGFPTICRQGLSSVATAAMCKQAVIYGDAVVAAVTIANKCYMLVRLVVLGLGQGYQPVAGYNYGAKKYGRTKQSFFFASAVGTVICAVSSVIIAIFAKEIMWWFCKDEEVLIYGVKTLHFACMVMPFMAFSTYVNQLYQSLGYKLEASILASLRQGIFYLPIIMIMPLIIGVTGVQMAQPLADFLTFVVSIPFCLKMIKRYLKEG